jgi:hypothetical protein
MAPIFTVLLVPVPKFVPFTTKPIPTGPCERDKLVMCGEVAVKLVVLGVLLTPETLTVSGPVTAPVGTATLSEVDDATEVGATGVAPLKDTVVFSVVPKLVPVIATEVPVAPLLGVKDEIAGCTVKVAGWLSLPLACNTTEVRPGDRLGTDTVRVPAPTNEGAIADPPLKLTVGVDPAFSVLIVRVVLTVAGSGLI